jgi:hypothetical protein
VSPSRAASVVAQSLRTEVRSRSGGGDGSRRRDARCRAAVLDVRGLFGPLCEPFLARL